MNKDFNPTRGRVGEGGHALRRMAAQAHSRMRTAKMRRSSKYRASECHHDASNALRLCMSWWVLLMGRNVRHKRIWRLTR